MKKYDPKKVIELTKEDFINEKVKRGVESLRKFFGRDATQEQIENVKKRYAEDYDKLINNNYDIGYLTPEYVKVAKVVLYENDFCFIDDKNVLYYIAD